MDFVDTTLLKLADPATRAAVFDQDGLEALASAGYDVDALAVSGPFSAVFDEVRLGYYAPRIASLEGTWQSADGHRTEATFRLKGLSDGDHIRVEAVWRGSIVARARPTTSRIVKADTAAVSLDDIDQDVVAALGALPGNPAALEAARRTVLVTRLKGVAADPNAVTPSFVDEWLAHQPASASQLVAAPGSTGTTGVTVAFSPPEGPAPGPVPLPVAVAVLIRETVPSIAQLVADSRAVVEMLEPYGLARRVATELRPRARLLVAWVLPAGVFDDNGWPAPAGPGGAAAVRARRRATAATWLAREGIGLITVA